MRRDSFVFYRSFYEALQDLNENERVLLYDAICKLALFNETTELTGLSNTVFKLIKPQIEANTKKYEKGLLGGRPKTNGLKDTKTNGYLQNETNGFHKGLESIKPNENVNVNENENNNYLSKLIDNLKIND